MPMIEIDENEYRDLMQTKALKTTVEQMMANPAARRKLLEARKAVDPNAAIPELDAAAPVEAAVTEVKTEFAALRKELAEEKAEREKEKNLNALNSRWEKGRADLRAQGYTDEGIAEIEKVMEAEGIANHAAAAAYYDRLHPPAEPVVPTSNKFDIFAAPKKDDVMKLLHDGDDDGFLNTVIAEVRAEGKTANGGRR